MAHAEYTVRLDAFEGPLDLLLFLIRRAEVEITDIPVGQITRQYLDYLHDLASDGSPPHHGIDIERAGEFLVMAATLMEIKSRMLTPPLAPEASEENSTDPTKKSRSKQPTDPRAELVKQLLEYKRFRDASDRLEKYKHDWEVRFPTGKALAPKAPPPSEDDHEDARVELEDVGIIDLVEAFARIIETVDFSRVGEHHVLMDDTPVELHAEDIIDRLKRHAAELLAAAANGSGGATGTTGPDALAPGEIEFKEFFTGRTRSEAIGMFLAVLELVKQQRIAVRQEQGAGRIVLHLADPADDVSLSPTPDKGNSHIPT